MLKVYNMPAVLTNPLYISLGSIVVFSSIIKIKNSILTKKLELEKKELKKIKQVFIPQEIVQKHKELDISYLANEEIIKHIYHFEEVLKANLPEDYLKTFYNNINSVMIEQKKPFLFKSKELASYDADNNIITFNDEISLSIYHELFHLATCILEGELNYSGFHQVYNDIEIGMGINEGYTEYLSQKYFGKKEDEESYDFQIYVAKQLNKILGEDLITKYYFQTNLSGLIDEMSKYLPKEEVFEFINELDFVTQNEYKCSMIYASYIDQSYINVQKFLFKLYTAKTKYKKELADIETILDLVDFASNLDYKLEDKNNCYVYQLNKSYINNTVNDFYPNIKEFKKI